ncbi:MAG TPA: dienelactone hydrolase family protein [Acidimicrobiales bacterium]|nr:dienelactone hydrolase family protein [Acidimicrobiales bacterium]
MTTTLEGYTESTFTHDGDTKAVFRTGSGPAVVVIHEVPGITPLVADFGRRVAAAGCTAVLPSLFGTPGKEPTMFPYIAGEMVKACVSREFATLALGRTSPVTGWLRALARTAHAECGGPGVGVVGMCLTGGFALAMMVDDEVLAPVLSQPSLPLPIGGARKSALGISDDDLVRVQQRVTEDGVCVLGLRFSGDSLVPPERFEALRQALGDGFIGVEIDSGKGNAHGIRAAAHSVLTEDLVAEAGHPTNDALEQVLDHLSTRLLGPA